MHIQTIGLSNWLLINIQRAVFQLYAGRVYKNYIEIKEGMYRRLLFLHIGLTRTSKHYGVALLYLHHIFCRSENNKRVLWCLTPLSQYFRYIVVVPYTLGVHAKLICTNKDFY
jgi:hypothetical protein